MAQRALIIIGFGSVARSWCQNLKDSNYPFRVALRKNSASWTEAENLGARPLALGDKELKNYQYFALLIPDHLHKDCLFQWQDSFPKDAKFILAHGHSFTYDLKQEKANVPKEWTFLLLAPKCIASEFRHRFLEKKPLGAVYSVEDSSGPENDEKYLLNLAANLGIGIGPFKVKMQQEVVADLFSEQALLCGVMPFVAKMCFEKLIERGIPEELAYLECWTEMGSIAQALVDIGPHKFFQNISPNALLGAWKAKKFLIDSEFEKKIEILLSEIEDESFSREVHSLGMAEVERIQQTVATEMQEHQLQRSFLKMNAFETKKVPYVSSGSQKKKNKRSILSAKRDLTSAESPYLSMLTCYDFQTAQLLAETSVDMLLVGDSLGNVVLGYETTVEVTIEEMTIFSSAVKRGAPNKFIVADLPFATAANVDQGVSWGVKLFKKSRVDALKLEGANIAQLQIIERMIGVGIPVVGHIGLQPQFYHQDGGYFIHGKAQDAKDRLMEEARKLQECGVMAIVLECVEKELAQAITQEIKIPTIGIGSGAGVDGQVLVINDVLQMGPGPVPKFCTPCGNLYHDKRLAVERYLGKLQKGLF